MVKLKLGRRTVELPYTVQIRNVTEAMFYGLADEDTRAELIDGTMVVYSPATPREDNLAGFLRATIRCYAEHTRQGAVFGPKSVVRLTESRIFAPSIFLFRRDRLPRPLPEIAFEIPPDFVIELLTSCNRRENLDWKLPAYQQAGVAEVWLIDLQHQEIFVARRLQQAHVMTTITKVRLESTALQGFWIDPNWLWNDDLPDVLTYLRDTLGDLA